MNDHLITSSHRQHRRSRDRRDDPLGLTVLHEPEASSQRSVDIIFIHGLSGTSLRTWCFRRDVDYLWPQLWLPKEKGLSSARVLTYGYNAHFSSRKEQASLAIADFTNDLLFRMRYGENAQHRLGQVSIVVVAHSMGGLVFKKAYMQGMLNDEFRPIVSIINAVLFLATPHQGTNLADTLNIILTSSIFGHTSKEYIAELARNSPTIDDWAIDLEKTAVKFGRSLSEDPSMIYKCVPALSPSCSAISQMFSCKPTTILSVRGTMNKAWDDCMVSGSSGRALRLACSSLYLAVAVEIPRGDVILWNSLSLSSSSTTRVLCLHVVVYLVLVCGK